MAWESEVWVLHRTRTVLVGEDLPGIPAGAIVGCDGTIGGTFFRWEDHTEFATWEAAVRFAQRKAAELGYALEYGP